MFNRKPQVPRLLGGGELVGVSHKLGALPLIEFKLLFYQRIRKGNGVII